MLIFCASKAWCEITAKHIAKMLAIPERSTPKAAQQVNGLQQLAAVALGSALQTCTHAGRQCLYDG